jgi:hypothetical protein
MNKPSDAAMRAAKEIWDAMIETSKLTVDGVVYHFSDMIASTPDYTDAAIIIDREAVAPLQAKLYVAMEALKREESANGRDALKTIREMP